MPLYMSSSSSPQQSFYFVEKYHYPQAVQMHCKLKLNALLKALNSLSYKFRITKFSIGIDKVPAGNHWIHSADRAIQSVLKPADLLSSFEKI